MIVCPRCAKENQSHYKFCLGCGAELPRDNAQPKSFTAPTPPAGVPAAEDVRRAPAAAAARPAAAASAAAVAARPAAARPAAAQPVAAQPVAAQPRPASVAPAARPAAAAGPATLPCPNCGAAVPQNFKFCGSCGHDMVGAAAPARAAAPVAAAPAPTVSDLEGKLVLIRPDGSEGESFPLRGETVIGRTAADPFASDSYMSPQHAKIRATTQGMTVSDVGSLNGVYLQILPEVPTELHDGSVFRIGQEIIRFEKLAAPSFGPEGEELMGSPNPGYLGRIRLVIGKDVYGSSYCVSADGMYLGRERGDIIFPDDGYVSGLHCRLYADGGRNYLMDVGSSNGTFVRLHEETLVASGSLLLMGQQLFRVIY